MKCFFTTSALAVGLALGVAGSGHAGTVWFENVDIPIPTTPTGVYIDLTNGATGTSGPFAGGDANFWFGGYLIGNEGDLPAVPSPSWQPVRLAADNLGTIANLPLGTIVDGSSTYGNDFGGSFDHMSTGQFTDGVPGYIGFSLDNGSGPVYGWLQLTIHFDGANGGVIHSWAYEDSGAKIPVGAPEPGTSLLALLGLGTLVLRRRR